MQRMLFKTLDQGQVYISRSFANLKLFLPVTLKEHVCHAFAEGRITGYLPPGGPFVRMDSHIYSDYVVPPSYDSLLGKASSTVAFFYMCG